MKTIFIALIASLTVLTQANFAQANEKNIEYYHPEASQRDLTKRPAIPSLKSPAPLALIEGTEVTFQWLPVETATAYALQLSDDANFYNLLVNETLLKETTYTYKSAELKAGKNYYWRVAAVKENNQNGSIKSLFNRSGFTIK